MDAVRQVAQAVLYEGYLLWPYRRSALKNQRRWTFGGVYPKPYSTAGHADDPWLMRTECLLEGDDRGSVDVSVRFLQVVRRDVGRLRDGELELVDELIVGDERHLAWEEAVEREVGATGLGLAGLLDAPHRVAIDIAAGTSVDPLADPADPAGAAAGAVVRSWHALRGHVETGAERVAPGVVRLTVTIANTTDWRGRRHDEAATHALISTHTVLHATGGRFVSLTDPPDALQAHVAACRNVKTWPVLVGEEGERHTMLSSPIIMYDYPKVAPESPGDLFDATEIDQLLTLSTLALSDEERRELRDTDPRARALLDRCASLAPEQLMRLHGTFRDVRAVPDGLQAAGTSASGMSASGGTGFWAEMGSRGRDTVTVGGVALGAGSRVRLRPRSRGDVFDLALDGRTAVVEAVEEDDDGGIHLAVTVEDDPGRDLGEARLPGHRFFFAPEEVQPLDAGAGSGAAAVPRVLVAGMGDAFGADDRFGVEVVRRLARRPAPAGVDAVDFGLRGMDLLHALQRGYDAAIIVHAAPEGRRPGTLSVVEAGAGGGGAVGASGLDPAGVLKLARELGRAPARVLVVACEPVAARESGPPGAPAGLSEPVRSAVDEAVELIPALAAELLDTRPPGPAGRGDRQEGGA